MPSFKEILTEAQLPPPGTRCEDHTFDLKGGHNPSKPLEWAKDVAAFLTWAADPNLDSRKEIGLRATLFLIFLSILAIATKRRVWRESV